MIRARLLLFLFPLAAAVPLQGQDSVIVIDPDAPASDSTEQGGLPPWVLGRLLEVWNDTLTVRLPGGITIPAGSSLTGQLAAFRGVVRVGGEITGSLTVINGDLTILNGGVIHGDVLVAGGRMTVDSAGVLDGTSQVYWDAASVLRQPDGTLAPRERRRPLGELATAQRTFRSGSVRTTLRLTTGQTYNRIEGLPVVFGGALEWQPSRRLLTRLDARGVLRTAGNDSPFRHDLGYSIRADLRLNPPRGFGLSGRAYSVIAGIEEHALPKDEIGWSAFLLQRDNRDYFNNEGVSGSAYMYPARRLRVEGVIRYENQGSVRATDPWSLFRNADRWRPNPLIDDGHYTTVGIGADLDTRNTEDANATGWWIRGSIERSHSNDVAPLTLPAAVRDPLPTRDYAFTRLTLDARWYTRLGAADRLHLRGWLGGWVDGDPLPVQRRLSLGGLDLLPGYAFRSFTCGPIGFTDPSQAALCDRAFAIQGEYRHRLSINLGYTYRDQEHKELDRFIGIDELDLVLLGNTGQAWLAGDGPGRVPSDRFPSIKDWKADVGAGVDAGWFGVYLVKAVTDGEPIRFFIRLARRF
jgi:hypothetical protein